MHHNHYTRFSTYPQQWWEWNCSRQNIYFLQCTQRFCLTVRLFLILWDKSIIWLVWGTAYFNNFGVLATSKNFLCPHSNFARILKDMKHIHQMRCSQWRYSDHSLRAWMLVNWQTFQRNLSTTPHNVTPLTFYKLLDDMYDLEKILMTDELYTKWINANIHNISGV